MLPRATKGLAIQFLGVRQRFSYICSYFQEERLSDILYASHWWPTSRWPPSRFGSGTRSGFRPSFDERSEVVSLLSRVTWRAVLLLSEESRPQPPCPRWQQVPASILGISSKFVYMKAVHYEMPIQFSNSSVLSFFGQTGSVYGVFTSPFE